MFGYAFAKVHFVFVLKNISQISLALHLQNCILLNENPIEINKRSQC